MSPSGVAAIRFGRGNLHDNQYGRLSGTPGVRQVEPAAQQAQPGSSAIEGVLEALRQLTPRAANGGNIHRVLCGE